MTTFAPEQRLQQLTQGTSRNDVVLALHSLGASANSWQATAAHCSLDFYAFDQLAHGMMRDIEPDGFYALVGDARDMLEAVPGARVHLVGHSLGGCVAGVLAATDRSDRIASLAIVASPLRGFPAFLERATADTKGGMTQVSEVTLERWFGPEGRVAYPQAWSAAQETLLQMRPHAFNASWRALAAFGGFASLPPIAVPTLVCSFKDDLSTPLDVGAATTRALQKAGVSVRHEVLPDGGHMGVLTHPEALGRVLAAHWEAVGFLGAEGVKAWH